MILVIRGEGKLARNACHRPSSGSAAYRWPVISQVLDPFDAYPAFSLPCGTTSQPRQKKGGSAGTRTRNQRLKRALLYRLSYRPESFSLEWSQGFFNSEQTRKNFGAALPIDLPTPKAPVCSGRKIFQSRTNPVSEEIVPIEFTQ